MWDLLYKKDHITISRLCNLVELPHRHSNDSVHARAFLELHRLKQQRTYSIAIKFMWKGFSIACVRINFQKLRVPGHPWIFFCIFPVYLFYNIYFLIYHVTGGFYNGRVLNHDLTITVQSGNCGCNQIREIRIHLQYDPMYQEPGNRFVVSWCTSRVKYQCDYHLADEVNSCEERKFTDDGLCRKRIKAIS